MVDENSNRLIHSHQSIVNNSSSLVSSPDSSSSTLSPLNQVSGDNPSLSNNTTNQFNNNNSHESSSSSPERKNSSKKRRKFVNRRLKEDNKHNVEDSEYSSGEENEEESNYCNRPVQQSNSDQSWIETNPIELKPAKKKIKQVEEETKNEEIITKKDITITNGSKVAARIGSSNDEGCEEGFWILASVVKYIPDKQKYEVEDEDSDDEDGGKHYKLKKECLVPISTEFSQHKILKKGEKCLAIFPDTTTFYSAIVDSSPTPFQRYYYLRFDDDTEDGKTPLRKVNYKYVMSCPPSV
ncbi:hypothetical protein ABK040_013367 [Willaertia magna]